MQQSPELDSGPKGNIANQPFLGGRERRIRSRTAEAEGFDITGVPATSDSAHNVTSLHLATTPLVWLDPL